MTEPAAGTVRIDRWLWAARMFKTRSLAARAVDGGKIRLNDARPRSSAAVRVGDVVRVQRGPIERTLVVTGLAERRGPAADAARLYEETAESRESRRAREVQLRMMPETSFRGKGRPTKKERRDLDRLREPWPE